jgi:hypothetical protein
MVWHAGFVTSAGMCKFRCHIVDRAERGMMSEQEVQQ